jgi:hypothetical protein
MLKRRKVRLVGVRRRGLVVAVVSLSVGLGVVAPAWGKEPAGDFAVFKQCPRFTAGVELCLYSQALSGEVVIGKQAVPLVNPVTLQGGVIGAGSPTERFVGALNGETLSKTPQKVPGGLLGFSESRLTSVSAITELARPAGEIGINMNNIIDGEGVGLSIPVRIRLENPLLGHACFIGSSASPIMLNLTTGTTKPPPPNTPISGNAGVPAAKDEFEFLEITNNKLVDNTFSAPEATGCGSFFPLLISRLIDAKLGLPSTSGKNTIIQNNTLKVGTTVGTINSEK